MLDHEGGHRRWEAPGTTGTVPTMHRATLRPEHLYKAAALLFLCAVLFRYLEEITRVLLIVYAAAILAVLFNAVVRMAPFGRRWMAALLGLLILSGTVAALWVGIPILIMQVRDLAGQIPRLSILLTAVEQWIKANTDLQVNLVGARFREFLRDIFLGAGGSGVAIVSRARGLLEYLVLPLLILFGALYAAGKPNEGLLTPLLRMVPPDRRPAFRRIFGLLGSRLLGWVEGVLIGMVAVGILSYVGYQLAGVPNALALAVVAGLTEAVPIVGPWIGGGIATTAGFLESPTTGMYAAVVALTVQQLEASVIIPWAMSRTTKVHPFVTLFALLLFGTLFGFLGVLLSVPIVLLIGTVVQVLWVERFTTAAGDRIEPVVDE